MLAFIVFWLAGDNRSGAPGTSRESRHRDHAPFGMVAIAVVVALGTLAICLFWPYMLPLVSTSMQTAAPHAGLAFMFLGAGVFMFPLMLLFTAIDHAVGRGRPRPQVPASITCETSSTPLNKQARSRQRLAGRAVMEAEDEHSG